MRSHVNALFLFMVFASSSCTAPQSWKSAYLYSDVSRIAPLQKEESGNGLFSTGAAKSNSAQMGGQKQIRVKLYEGPQPNISAESYRFLPGGKRNAAMTGRGNFVPTGSGLLETDACCLELNRKQYPGKFLIYPSGDSFLVVNLVSESDYLPGVVAHEMSPEWPIEALKAQAVLARTYLYNVLSRPESRKYDIDSTTRHQVYGGLIESNSPAVAAVRETAGQVVMYGGNLASVFYHSCEGGYTASAQEVWGREVPYLVARKSDYCSDAPPSRWQIEFTLAELEEKFGVGSLQQIHVLVRSASQRVVLLELRGSKGKTEISGSDFRNALGSTRIKSTLFDIRLKGNAVQIAGRGFGHGVGLSQWGAYTLAGQYRQNYREILAFYFPGTELHTY